MQTNNLNCGWELKASPSGEYWAVTVFLDGESIGVLRMEDYKYKRFEEQMMRLNISVQVV